MVSRREFLRTLAAAPLAAATVHPRTPARALGARAADPSRRLYLAARPLDLTAYTPEIPDPRPVRQWARATVGSHVSTLHEPGLPRLGVVRFNWFEIKRGRQTGQLPGPWLPHDSALQAGRSKVRIAPGMQSWTGSVSYHERHLRALIAHGFDLLVFQVPHGWRRTQINHLRALRNLRREGPIPTLAPFFEAASYREYFRPKDFTQPAYREALYRIIARYFDLHFTFLGPEDLTWKDGRPLIYLWWIPGARDAPPDILDEMSARLRADFGFEPYWSVHEYWAHTRADTVDLLFHGVESFRRDGDGNMTIMPGFYPPNEETLRQGLFLPRLAGDTYWDAWSRVIDDVRRRRRAPAELIVESDNEVGEGTAITSMVEPDQIFHLTGRNETACTHNSCRVPGAEQLQDSLGSNPLQYLEITRARKQELLEVARSLL
ncbi:MAG TPA: hypothetical protein VMV46_16635 [Thermoanaerobaculia bacterium]|nr:hypothetical protein [Thermoanaerobaculia bacterium]